MKEKFNLLHDKFPEISNLLRPPTTDSTLLVKAKSLDLPNDYYDIYSMFDGEEDDSNGVFGLHKLLPLSESLAKQITDKDELKDIPNKYQYDLFVPVFKTPGRQMIGYAKHGDEWDFAEYDIWLSKHQEYSVNGFLHVFFDKLEKDGYTTEDGINGLIDIDEM